MRPTAPTLLALTLAAVGCEATTSHHRPHHGTVPPVAEAPQSRETTVEAARGGTYNGRATCGESHVHYVEMGANEALRVTFRATLGGAEPLGEDLAWRWIGPSRTVLDTNTLPVPQPNGPAVEQSWEVRSTLPGRYAVAVVVESGAACAHASFTLELR